MSATPRTSYYSTSGPSDRTVEESQVDDSQGAESAVQKESRASKLDKSPRFNLAVKIAGLGAAIVTIAGGQFVVERFSVNDSSGDIRSGEPTQVDVPDRPTGEDEVTVKSNSLAGKVADALPECLYGGIPTACDRAHDQEVFRSAECTTDSAIRYFGGVPSRDLILSAISVNRFDDESCVVDLPKLATARMQNALERRDGDSLRWCVLDADLLEGVPCDQPHFGEVTYTSEPDSTVERDCLASVEDYLEKSLRDARPLVSRDATLSGRPSCLVTVTGNQKLTASVRNLVARSVPLG